MKTKLGIKMMVVALLSVVLLFTVSCKKKEAPSAPKGLKAEVFEDHIRLSWNKVFNADYYSIIVGFCGRDENNVVFEETYDVFLNETSNTNYKDIYPFEGMNYYKIKAVNEYGSSSYSEVSCYYPECTPSVFLSPNPAKDYLILSIGDETISLRHLTIESILGHVIMDFSFEGCVWMDTSQYDAGIYLAHINTEYGEVVKRFVVTHD